MRAIDADAVVELFEPFADALTDTEVLSAYIETLQLISNAPTIDIPTWIPCSERLPERQGYYICTCKDGTGCKRTTPVKWSNGWQLTGARAYWLVIAWMPLPQPFGEREGE